MNLEECIQTFGKEIFELIGEEQPSTFNKKAISGRIMEWSMSRPDFKVNMFRLVDVLPTLHSAQSVARHVTEYLEEPAKDLHGVLGWGISAAQGLVRSQITALAVRKSVKEMAQMYIAGESPKTALKALRSIRKEGRCFTVDLLGEYSVSEHEADVYLQRYLEALHVLGETVPTWKEAAPLLPGHPGDASPINISVKLSALYSQCSMLNFDRSVSVLSDRLSQILRAVKKNNARVYLDAEDTATNPIIIATFKRVFSEPEFVDIPYPGIVLQAYCTASEHTCQDLINFAKERGAPIAIRLVKGAYWDQEIVAAAQHGWENPLFETKSHSDAQFEALSKLLIDNYKHVLPAFGSHNVRSLSHACCYAESQGLKKNDFELQMLYGMADPIARSFEKKGFLVRMYVPVGEMLPGMGYLVRRLLENTSNESFLRHTFVRDSEIASLLRKPEPYSLNEERA